MNIYQPKKARYSCLYEIVIEADNYFQAIEKFNQIDANNEYKIIKVITD